MAKTMHLRTHDLGRWLKRLYPDSDCKHKKITLYVIDSQYRCDTCPIVINFGPS